MDEFCGMDEVCSEIAMTHALIGIRITANRSGNITRQKWPAVGDRAGHQIVIVCVCIRFIWI